MKKWPKGSVPPIGANQWREDPAGRKYLVPSADDPMISIDLAGFGRISVPKQVVATHPLVEDWTCGDDPSPDHASGYAAAIADVCAFLLSRSADLRDTARGETALAPLFETADTLDEVISDIRAGKARDAAKGEGR